METIKTQWTGIRPLLMHNGLLADPENPYSRKMKEINAKGTKKTTDADYERRAQLEWEGSLYWDEGCGLHIPTDNIERCIQLGAAKSRLGKDVQASVFVSDELVPLTYEGPSDKNDLYKSGRFILKRGVVVNKGRVIRVRPMVPTGWKIEFTLEFDETIINAKSLVKAMVDAGMLVGLGDWRPKFGRFTVNILK